MKGLDLKSESAKISIDGLKEKIRLAKSRKKYLENYLYRLNISYNIGKISHSFYVETLHKHYNGKSIQEWISYYEHCIKEYENLIKKYRKDSIKRKLPVFFILTITIYIMFLYNARLSPTGSAILSPELGGKITFPSDAPTKNISTSTLTTLDVSYIFPDKAVHYAILKIPDWTVNVQCDLSI
ncbi:MAG: hypothetical protein QXU39_02440, partial [Candidatus Pacearchaeota archaeon]